MRLDPAFLKRPSIKWLVEALGADNILFVGGAVRDALLGVPSHDIDAATPLEPQVVIDRLAALDIKTIPTGLDHGTVTALVHGDSIEITTFRADVSTDGRRATVAFTTDFRKDAQRRDFTMNALYMRPDGTVLDPTGGIQDCRRGHVRFIGDAEQRIREDYLRIYRYFRFLARFGMPSRSPGTRASGYDKHSMAHRSDTLAVIEANRDGLASVSAERIGVEMMKMLAVGGDVGEGGPNSGPNSGYGNGYGDSDPLLACLRDMMAAKINPARLLTPDSLTALKRLEANKPRASEAKDMAWVRLAHLTATADVPPPVLRKELKLSNAIIKQVAAVVANIQQSIQQQMTGAEPVSGGGAGGGSGCVEASRGLIRDIAYRHGVPAAAAVLDGASASKPSRRALVAYLAQWDKPKLPIAARDLLSLGFGKDPALGAFLKRAEARWLESDFTLTRLDLLQPAADFLRRYRDQE